MHSLVINTIPMNSWRCRKYNTSNDDRIKWYRKPCYSWKPGLKRKRNRLDKGITMNINININSNNITMSIISNNQEPNAPINKVHTQVMDMSSITRQTFPLEATNESSYQSSTPP